MPEIPGATLPPLASCYRRGVDTFEVVRTYGVKGQRVELRNLGTLTPYHTDRLSLADEGFVSVDDPRSWPKTVYVCGRCGALADDHGEPIGCVNTSCQAPEMFATAVVPA